MAKGDHADFARVEGSRPSPLLRIEVRQWQPHEGVTVGGASGRSVISGVLLIDLIASLYDVSALQVRGIEGHENDALHIEVSGAKFNSHRELLRTAIAGAVGFRIEVRQEWMPVLVMAERAPGTLGPHSVSGGKSSLVEAQDLFIPSAVTPEQLASLLSLKFGVVVVDETGVQHRARAAVLVSPQSLRDPDSALITMDEMVFELIPSHREMKTVHLVWPEL